jgi:Domain of unknown function (DUF5134)
MAGPSWLAITFAAVMILIAAYSAGRLLFARRRGRATETDADALHVVMGAAMAGMLVPRLSLLPGRAWAAVFAVAAAWFGWHALRARAAPGVSRCHYPVPHLIECAAMIYMLLPAAGPRPARAGPAMTMPGMSAAPSPAAGFPALAAVLALSMIGYIIWTTDRLAALARAKATTASPGLTRGHPPAETAAAPPARPGPAAAATAASGTGTRPGNPAREPLLAPKLAACCKIAMSIAMGYMLILML